MGKSLCQRRSASTWKFRPEERPTVFDRARWMAKTWWMSSTTLWDRCSKATSTGWDRTNVLDWYGRYLNPTWVPLLCLFGSIPFNLHFNLHIIPIPSYLPRSGAIDNVSAAEGPASETQVLADLLNCLGWEHVVPVDFVCLEHLCQNLAITFEKLPLQHGLETCEMYIHVMWMLWSKARSKSRFHSWMSTRCYCFQFPTYFLKPLPTARIFHMGCPRSLASGDRRLPHQKSQAPWFEKKLCIWTFLCFHLDPFGITRHFSKSIRIELYREFFSEQLVRCGDLGSWGQDSIGTSEILEQPWWYLVLSRNSPSLSLRMSWWVGFAGTHQVSPSAINSLFFPIPKSF